MAASRLESSMPRRRNCFSIISARCGAYLLFSSMRNRRGVLFPGAGLENLFHLCQGKVAFVIAIVKMRGEADAGFGAVVDEDFARQEFAANFIGMRAFDGDSSGALRGIFRRVDFPTARFCAGDETGGHAN